MLTINIKDITELRVVKLVDLSDDSINKIVEAVAQKIVNIDLVKHGHWVYAGHGWAGEGIYKCSICGHHTPDNGNYCSYCGAKMDEVET